MSTFPIRCFTCGKVINNKYNKYKDRVAKGDSPFQILDDFKLEKMCCRRMFISHGTERLEEIQLMYPSTEDRIIEVGSKPTSFQASRAKVQSLIEED